MRYFDNLLTKLYSSRIWIWSLWTYQASPASNRMPKVQNPSKQTSTIPLFFAGKNSVYIEKATGAPPMPNPRSPRNMHIVARPPAAVDANPTYKYK